MRLINSPWTPSARLRSVLAGTLALVAVSLPAGVAADGPSKPALVLDGQAAIDVLKTSVDCAQGAPISDIENCYQPDTQQEPAIAVNPTNPDNVVAVFADGLNINYSNDFNAGIGATSTFDGGRSWRQAQLAFTKHTRDSQGNPGPSDEVTEPEVVFGPPPCPAASARGQANSCAPQAQEIAYAIAYTQASTETDQSIMLSSSPDGGRSWGSAHVVSGHGDEYFPQIAVDRGGVTGQHHPGRLYASWGGVPWGALPRVCVGYSDDAGASWVLGPTGYGFCAYGSYGFSSLVGTSTLTVLPNGDVAMFLVSFEQWILRGTQVVPPGQVRLAVFQGAGSVISGQDLAVPLTAAPVANRHGQNLRQLDDSDVTSAAVDASGRLYLTMTDGQRRSDGMNDVVLSSCLPTPQDPDCSKQGWSSPKYVNPPTPAYVNSWSPALTATGDGQVAIAYRQRQEAGAVSPDGWLGSDRSVKTLVQVSNDAGRTFTDPLQVSSVIDHSDIGFAAAEATFYGGSVTSVLHPPAFQVVAHLGFRHMGIAMSADRIYVGRAEAVRVSDAESHAFPPTYHHQRTWVARVALGTRPPVVKASESGVSLNSVGILPNTSGGGGTWELLLAGLLVLSTFFALKVLTTRPRMCRLL